MNKRENISNTSKVLFRGFRGVLFFVFFPVFAYAQTEYVNDIQTIYSERTYVTVSKTTVDASLNTANTVLDKFIDDLIADPESLFLEGRMLEGLGSKDDKEKELFLIEYQGYNYNKTTGLYTGTLNIFMNKTKLSNIDFTGKITRTAPHKNVSEAFFELVDNNPIVKIAKGKIVVKQIDSQTIEIEQTATFQFRWLFNLFFTQNNYRNLAEWRLDKFLENIKREMLREEER